MHKIHPVPIVFAINSGYAQYCATAICSICLNSTSRHRFICITDDVSSSLLDPIKHVVERHGCTLDVIDANAHQYIDLGRMGYETNASYFRLSMYENVKSDRALYLDSDILVTCDITKLLEINLNGKAVGAVRDSTGGLTTSIPMRSSNNYFNSGVMLVDLHRFDRSAFVRAFFKSYAEHKDKLKYPDQCVFNVILEPHTQLLSDTYNKMLHITPKKERDQVFGVDGDPAVLHFSSHEKPWMLWCSDQITNHWMVYTRLAGLTRAKIQRKPSTVWESFQLANKFDDQRNFESASRLKGELIDFMLLNYMPKNEQT